MIKYNLNTINDWNFGDDNIIKVYRNNAVCYYKVTSDTPTPVQEPCFAVVDNISQYSETEFEDVFNIADDKWYKLNNLSQYEQYGIYGEGRNITYYEGKLTVDDGYEYMYSGGSWVNLGEVTGGTASLPDVPFTVNYNAKNYNSSTKTLLKTSGQLADVDAVITAGTPTVHDGYLTIASGTRATISGYQTYFNRDNNNPNITIISKQTTDGSLCHMFANRDTTYNWMYRPTSTKLNFHGSSQIAGTNTTTQPVIESVRVNSSRLLTFNNYTDNTSSTQSSFNYGSTNSGNFAIFAGYATRTGEWFAGDFYWVYMSQTTLTDEQVQQVIAYNEGGSGQTEYPLEYVVREDPPDNLVFTSMTEAQSYECPWWGMSADIDNTDYMFCEGNEWLTKYSYVEVAGDYICDNGDKYKKMQEYDRQADGTMSPTSNYVKGGLIESGSTDCEQQFDGKWIAYYANGNVAYSAACGSSTAITKSEVRSGSYQQYKKVIIGDCVNRVREAFQQCTSMTDLEIGTGVTESLYYAFEDCTALTAATWYATGLANNQDGGFQRCSALQKLVMYATTPPSLSSTFFRGVNSSLVIYVPDSAVSAYQSTIYWRNYTIKGHSELPT